MTRVLRTLATLGCLILLGALGVSSGPAPVSASTTSSKLCTGYAGCALAGMPNAGYKAASGTMWWRMYSGHNCTNYAAYRMVHSGLPNVRPWSGGGNATYWGGSNARLTDSVPAVGAVAWWRANAGPAGSSGHVAYVERVVSADEVIVSQDSWGGDFSWARITRSSGNWPSGFIHFNDLALTNTAPPALSGTPKVGARLTASPGGWTPSGATYAYEWRADGVVIATAGGPSLKLRIAQQGKRISVRTTASKLGYPAAVATSAGTSAVAPGKISNSVPPTIAGEASVDSTLTASAGTWTPVPLTLAYQWSADGAPVAGANGSTLALGPDLVGKTLAVTVTGSRAGYLAVSSRSAPTAPVAPGTFTMSVAPTLTGAPRLGETLTLDPGTVTPSGAEASVQWLRAGAVVPGRSGLTYLMSQDDLGSRIRARVNLTRPGYTPLSTQTVTTWRVTSPATLKVQTSQAGPGSLRVVVTVTAPGVDSVPGIVVIRAHGGVIQELDLRRGAAAVTLTGLTKGHASFAFRYLGGEAVTPTSRVTRKVWIQ